MARIYFYFYSHASIMKSKLYFYCLFLDETCYKTMSTFIRNNKQNTCKTHIATIKHIFEVL